MVSDGSVEFGLIPLRYVMPCGLVRGATAEILSNNHFNVDVLSYVLIWPFSKLLTESHKKSPATQLVLLSTQQMKHAHFQKMRQCTFSWRVEWSF